MTPYSSKKFPLKFKKVPVKKFQVLSSSRLVRYCSAVCFSPRINAVEIRAIVESGQFIYE